MSCTITYNNQQMSEREFVEKHIPQQGEIIEYDGVEYMVHNSNRMGSHFLNYEALSEESTDLQYDAINYADQIPFYNLDPVGKGTVELGFDPIFNIPLTALLQDGFTKTGKTFDYEQYKNTFGQGNLEQDLMFQSKDMSASKASEETLDLLKASAKQMGIDIQGLEEYAKSNPDIDVKGINGLADLIQGTIAIAQGKEDVALTEEIVHMATAILEQTNPRLITELIGKIGRFKIYNQTLQAYKGKKAYQLSDGKPDIRKIKKEAVDKLIAELIINQSEGSTEFPELMEEEDRNMIQRWWDTILDYIKGVYGKSNIDIFKTAASQVLTGEVDGTVSDIESTGVFFQINDDVKKQIDDLYNTYMDYDGRLELFPETVEDKRHYKFDGAKVLKSVTEKVKEKFNKTFARTDAEKIVDEQKREWGSEGHAYIENYILNNLIDKLGYKRAKFGTEPISSKLSGAMQVQLGKFAQELVNSYPEGTRFLVEKKVVNSKVEGYVASTVDFKAFYPVTKADGTQSMKIDTLDWKFTSINKDKTDDIPWYKQDEWKSQMGEYTQIDYNYGAKRDQIGKTRMVPFVVTYDNVIPNDTSSALIATTLEIGKLDSLKETNMYLLPVPTIAESTGNPEVDRLVKSLGVHFEKLYSKPLAKGQQRSSKDEQLSQLSAAIRNLHVKLNFAPLVNVAESFLKNAKGSIDEFEKLDLSKLDDASLQKGLRELREYLNSASKFASMDQAFLSQFPKEGLDKEQKAVLLKLENINKSTLRMEDKIIDLLRLYTAELAVKQEIVTAEDKLSVLSPEVKINGFIKTWVEGTRLPAKIIKLASNLIMNSNSVVNRKTAKYIEDFGKVLIPLEQSAKAKGKKAFDMIGKMTSSGLELIQKIDDAFLEQVAKEKKNKNKQFFLDNIDKAKYNELAKTFIEENIKVYDGIIYSEDAEEDARIREFRKRTMRNSVDINRDTFNGYDGYEFNNLFMQSLKEENHYSKEYKQMASDPAALKVWEFFTELNKKGQDIGYLTSKQNSFFPLIEATTLEKFGQTSDVFGQLKDSFKGLYSTTINEEQSFSKIDPETGKVKKIIPKYFTRTDKSANQLSTDLNKVGALWIKSLLDYENSVNIEDTLQVLLAVEKSKGSLKVDGGNIIFDESGLPVEDEENENAKILEVIIDDALYKLQEDLDSLGSLGVSKITEKLSKTEEGKQSATVNIKKGLKNADTLTRALAVGLKPLIATANWAGGNFQSYINAGGLYNFWTDFTPNNLKVTSNRLSLIEKGLLHSIVPLNEDVSLEERRKVAKKQGLVSYLSTWSFSDVMMSTNAFPEKKLQLANALSIIDNSMVKDGKIVNIRQYLKAQDRANKYKLSYSERKELERTFEDRVKSLKESSSLTKITKIENDEVVIPGVSEEEIAKFRVKIIEYGRKLNGQMSTDNKAGYRRDTILSSFMMFKTWIPKLLAERTADISKNVEIGDWEYGRVRAFFKTWSHLGLGNVMKMRDIISGTEEGLRILDEMLEEKRADYYRKTGQQLEITNEEFYDLMRKELANEMKELKLLLIMTATMFAAAAAKPPEDASDLEKNRYKFWAKMTNKIADEITFYYNPLSFESMTKGTFLPSLNLLTKTERVFIQLGREYGDEPDKAYPQKAIFNLIPGLSQFQTEILPFVDPELAKEWGVRVSADSRRQ